MIDSELRELLQKLAEHMVATGKSGIDMEYGPITIEIRLVEVVQ